MLLISGLFLFAGVNLRAQDNLLITKNSVGPVKIGMRSSDLPKKVDGLYDKIIKKSEYNEMDDYEEVWYECTLAGQKTITIFVDESEVYMIDVVTPICKTAKGFNINSTAAQLLVSGAKVLQDNEGVGGIINEGVLFQGHPYTEAGLKKAEKAYLEGEQIFTIKDYVAKGTATNIRINNYISEYR